MDNQIFVEGSYQDFCHPGAIVFLAWFLDINLRPTKTISSFNDLESQFERVYYADHDDLKQQALIALSDENSIKFERVSIEYLVREKYPIYDHFISPSSAFKERWVALSFAHDFFNEMLPNPEKEVRGRGAPKLENNINTRRVEFTDHIKSQLMNWAYQLYLQTRDKITLPRKVNLSGSDDFGVVLSCESVEQLSELYKILRTHTKIGYFRNLQEFMGSRFPDLVLNNMPRIWSSLNNQIGLINDGEWVAEGTISKSLSLGNRKLKQEEKPKNHTFDLQMNWEADQVFLSHKSLF